MTQEELLVQELGMEYHSATNDQLSLTRNCMDEWANIKAVEFLKWCFKNKVQYNNENEIYVLTADGYVTYTYEVAYKKFLTGEDIYY